MTDPKQDEWKKSQKQPESNIREFVEFKMNGAVVQCDNDAPCDAEFEWMSDNRD